MLKGRSRQDPVQGVTEEAQCVQRQGPAGTLTSPNTNQVPGAGRLHEDWKVPVTSADFKTGRHTGGASSRPAAVPLTTVCLTSDLHQGRVTDKTGRRRYSVVIREPRLSYSDLSSSLAKTYLNRHNTPFFKTWGS